MESEVEGTLPFLDMRLIRERDKIEVDVYRKPTDAPLCIPADSCHHYTHKMAGFESAIYRMWRFPLNNERREREFKYIKEMAVLNGYRISDVQSIYEKHRWRKYARESTTLRPAMQNKNSEKNTHSKENKSNGFAIMPFYAPMSYKIEKVLKSHNISVCYENRGTMREIVGRVKGKRPAREESGIYRIGCQDCDKLYIGQTRRRMETREAEHDRACKNKAVDKSAVAAHCVEEKHRRGTCELVKKVDRPWDLDTWESMYIDKMEPDRLMNVGEPPMKSSLFKYALT